MQSAEALKLITGVGEPLLGRLWSIDIAAGTSRVLNFSRQDDCALCGRHPTIIAPELTAASCAMPSDDVPSVSAVQLRKHLQEGSDAAEEIEIWDIREEHERVGGTVPGARLVGSAALPTADPSPLAHRVVIYCQGGVRSARALPELLSRGVPASHLEGGFDAWHDLERESK